MKRLALTFALTFCSFNAFAQYEKTCDERELHGQCTEHTGNIGSPPTCPSGIGSLGRNCARDDDYGMCQRMTDVGGYVFGSYMFYYHGTYNCPDDMPQAEC